MLLMPTVQINGRAMHYLDSRAPGKPTLLLIHGAGGSHRVWPASLTTLDKTRVVALDLPGHGLSAPPGLRSVAHYAEAVEAFIKELDLENPIVVGHSLGSAIALAVAHRAHVPVRGLALLGAGARMPVGEVLLAGSLASLTAAADFIVAYGLAGEQPEARQAIHAELLAVGATTTYGDFLACNRFDIRPQLPAISTPTLAIAGESDRLTPARFARALASDLPHGRLVMLENAGHFAMLDQPQVVAEYIGRFAQELSVTGPTSTS